MNDFGLAKMQELLRDFYNLAHIKICICDEAGNELCYFPEKHTPFCKRLREIPEQDEKCRLCDKRAFAECKKTHRQYRYICHAGLLECVSPVLYGERIIGYIVVGQIRAEESGLPDAVLAALADATKQELIASYGALPLVEQDKINSAIRILDACAGYEHLKGLMSAAEGGIDRQIDAYVNSHLKDALSVSELCARFRLSRNELYGIFKDYFNDSPAEYINKRRLHRACSYLAQTDLAVNAIAQKCGIPDYNYFSKIFKKAFGVSPRAYRKSNSSR